MQLQSIRGQDHKAAIEKIDKFILEQIKPLSFGGSDGLEVKNKKGFEDVCFVINQHNSKPAKQMAVLEFYQAMDSIKKQYKEQKKTA